MRRHCIYSLVTDISTAAKQRESWPFSKTTAITGLSPERHICWLLHQVQTYRKPRLFDFKTRIKKRNLSRTSSLSQLLVQTK